MVATTVTVASRTERPSTSAAADGVATADPKATPLTMSKAIDDLKVDDPVWISGTHGMFKSKGAMYAFSSVPTAAPASRAANTA